MVGLPPIKPGIMVIRFNNSVSITFILCYKDTIKKPHPNPSPKEREPEGALLKSARLPGN
jgi:hypothetical protein